VKFIKIFFLLMKIGKMHFDFGTASRIIFGAGTSADLPKLCSDLGKHAFLVSDSNKRSSAVSNSLVEVGIQVTLFEVHQEPDVSIVNMAIRIFHEAGCDLVIGLGGGSVIDTGKAVAVLSNNPGKPTDYLELIGTGRTLTQPAIPMIAVPTTAGTGSEVTRNAVISIPGKQIKVSLRSHHLFPRIALIDPELTYSLPPEITARTGLDALTQLIEPYLCNSPTPLTDQICKDGIARAGQHLLSAYQDGQNIEAREAMSLASLYGGIALTNARLGAVHGLAGPLGGMYHAPHGSICARLLPIVMMTNLRAIRKRMPESAALGRFEEIARLISGASTANLEDGIAIIQKLCSDMEIRPLKDYGLKPDDFPKIIMQAQKSSSMKGNPTPLTDEELYTILEKAM
jgi:alcohol dehydrogenase class IV